MSSKCGSSGIASRCRTGAVALRCRRAFMIRKRSCVSEDIGVRGLFALLPGSGVETTMM